MNQLVNPTTFSFSNDQEQELPILNGDSLLLSYYDRGFQESVSSLGSSEVLNTCLEHIFEQFKDECRLNEQEQADLSKPYIEQKEQAKTELSKTQTSLALKLEELELADKKLQTIQSDITLVKSSPEKYGLDIDKKPKAQFYIGLTILLPITLYLIVFYISASYSAFFKNFETASYNAAIFDSNALTNAWNDGWLEAIYVGTIPFAFMGLGYLIHMFLKEKPWGKWKIAALITVTFLFDAILAYQIEKKIYDFEKTLDSPPFDLSIAVQDVPFWGIIFAGFVVYIIWGLVFDFVMKEYENFDKVKSFIRVKKEEMRNVRTEQDKTQGKVHQIKKEIARIQGTIRELQSKIDGFIFPGRKYKLYQSEYFKGWSLAIMETLHIPRNKKEELISHCKKVSLQHLAKCIAEENSIEVKSLSEQEQS